jgi:uncharacterized protein YbgA (DUF1722 family)/uncharacterized protein YbbK (DUF523 family)
MTSLLAQEETSTLIRIGISACLMGQPVRFNKSHKRSRFCTDVLSQYVEFVPLCPEVGIGMGTPRQAIRLVSDSAQSTEVRAVGSSDPSLDVTEPLTQYAQEQASRLNDLCGYILMQKSPSCGLFGVKRYLKNGHPEGTTQGIFAAEFQRHHPLLPMEEAGRLNDDALRENFLVRVYTLHDWRTFMAEKQGSLIPGDLIHFHSRYKYLVMAHSQAHYKSMGRLLANMKQQPLEDVAEAYIASLMSALAKPASRKMHTNTLMHLQGYLKQALSAGDKHELTDLIHQYREGIVPLVVPLTLLKHHISHQPESADYVRQQVYLNPHPHALGLRNAL